MSRTVNSHRPNELRAAILQYLLKHGLTDLSLRPLAKAVGSSPRALLYHFGSKEKIVVGVLADLRQQQRASYGRIQGSTLAEVYWKVWKRMTASSAEPLFRLFFEAYGIALRHPGLYADFLHNTIEDWLNLIATSFATETSDVDHLRALATVHLAALRGFLLDFCATHDRRRLNRAVKLWVGTLDLMLNGNVEDTACK